MHAASTSWLSIYLPRLNTDRLIRSGRAPEDKPLAVYAKEANAFVLKGVDARASSLGLKLAMSLAKLDSKDTACATLRQVPKAYPKASRAIINKVASEQKRLAC